MKKGLVINLCGGVYKVLLDDNNIINVKARGKLRSQRVNQINDKSMSKKEDIALIKTSPKVGDIVYIENDFIDHYDTRKNELIRPDITNIDQILLIFAAKEPDFSFYLLDLFLVNITKANIKPTIVITKIDKLNEIELTELKNGLNYYQSIGYDIHYVNNMTKEGIDDILDILDNKITVVAGQTGAGKSSLINSIIPDFNLKTQEISKSLGRGKHTTREASIYRFRNGFIGDTPGFSKLDVTNIIKSDLKKYFIEFKNYNCKFNDCNHQENIKGCMICENVSNGNILKSRYDSYLKIYALCKER